MVSINSQLKDLIEIFGETHGYLGQDYYHLPLLFNKDGDCYNLIDFNIPKSLIWDRIIRHKEENEYNDAERFYEKATSSFLKDDEVNIFKVMQDYADSAIDKILMEDFIKDER